MNNPQYLFCEAVFRKIHQYDLMYKQIFLKWAGFPFYLYVSIIEQIYDLDGLLVSELELE